MEKHNIISIFLDEKTGEVRGLIENYEKALTILKNEISQLYDVEAYLSQCRHEESLKFQKISFDKHKPIGQMSLVKEYLKF